MMRIGFINPWESFAPPDGGGSLGIWTWEVARRLASSDEVYVCGQGCPDVAAFEEVEGVRFFRWPVRVDKRLTRLMHRIGSYPDTPDIAHWFYYYIFLLRAALMLRSHDCDVIHIFNLSQFARILARLSPKAAIVLNMHCDWLVGMDYSVIEKRLQCVDGILGCADCITEEIRCRFPHYAEKCETLYNGVDVEEFCPPEAASNARDSNTLITVGRVSPEKGLHVLLDAFESILDKKPGAKLRIIGPEYSLRPEVITTADNNVRLQETFAIYGNNYLQKLKQSVSGSLGGNVSFVGALSREKIAAEMRNASVLVQPSLYDLSPMPVIEAMASGLPVVASQVGGLAEIVSDGQTGILVEPSNSGQLAEALVMLLDNPARAQAMGAAGRYRASHMFSWEVAVGKLRPFYERLNKGKRRSSWPARRGARNGIIKRRPRG
jgi:glycosyltransferase involved in cell wall biosynthesis